MTNEFAGHPELVIGYKKHAIWPYPRKKIKRYLYHYI